MTDEAPTTDHPATWWPATKLHPWAENPVEHPPEQIAEIRESLKLNGWGDVLVAHWPSCRLIGGHGTHQAALELLRDDPAWCPDGCPEPGLVPVRFRTGPWDEQEALALALNHATEGRKYRSAVLGGVLKRIEDRREAGQRVGFHGFPVSDVRRHLRRFRQPATDPSTVPDPGPGELPDTPASKRGELYQLGDHRLICGDSTDADTQDRLFDGQAPDVCLTDPPYCSGGFQESGKAAGSVGTRGDEMIARDTLSTRGYQALMRRVLGLTPAGVVYVFTDWRMWINLFDVVEEAGYGVRNMIVWDKGTPGMGVGWRHQHELIMAAINVRSPFDPSKAQGNVLDVDAAGLLLKAKRTGNRLHATEKPVDLLHTILTVTDLCERVHDPFAGSGPTLIAAAQAGRTWYGMELSPHYCDVTRRRWTAWAKEAGIEPGPGALE